MRTEDWAGNTKSTRRLFMFDDASVVTLINSRVYVTTAVEETNYRWINTETDIEIMWENRFINIDHVNNNWLNDVKQSNFIARELDDTNTVSARNMTGIHHIQGNHCEQKKKKTNVIEIISDIFRGSMSS